MAIVVVFLVFGAVLYTALSGGGDAPEPLEVASAPDVERREAEVPQFDFDSAPNSVAADEDDAPSAESSARSEARGDSDADDSKRTGKGKLTVNVEMDGGLNVPSNLQITLHFIPDDARYDSTADTVHAVKNPNADDKAIFEDLPLGYYVVFAQSATHTGTVNRSLTENYRDRETTVTLYPAGYISGSVVNTAGEPVTNAKVFVAGYLTGGRDTDAGLYRSRASGVAVDETGAYTMNNLQVRVPALQYRLMAMAPDYAPKITDLYPLGSTGVQIVLGDGGSVSGLVVNEDTGEAMPNVKLSAMPMHDLAQQETNTGEDGGFEFASLSPGNYTFVVEADELVVKGESLKLEVTDGLAIDDMRIAVMTGGVVEGRVFDADTGAGVSGVEMYGYPSDIEGASRKEATTDANGDFRLVGLHAGTYRIQYQQVEGYPDRQWEHRKEIVASLGRTISGLEFPMTKGLSISGVVVTEGGKAVEGGRVHGQVWTSNRRDSANIKENGSFAVYGFEPNDEVRLDVTPDGLGRIYETLQLEDSSITGLRLVAEEEARISGIVVNASGTPLSGINIYARNNTDRIMGGGRESNSAGEFELTQLSSGEYTLRQSHGNSYSSADVVLETVKLSKGEHRKNVRLVVTEDMVNDMEISGIVSDDAGKPIAGANVQSYSGRANSYTQTGADGRYTLRELPEGSVQLHFSHETHVQQNGTFEAGDMNAHMTLARMGVVSGRVVDAGSGSAIQGFSMQVYPAGPGGRSNNFKSFYDENGEFTITGTHPNVENTLKVRAEGYAETLVPIQGAQSGQTIRGVIIRLPNEAKVTGVVTDDNGSPVSSAWIYIGALPRNEWERDRNRAATSGPDGTFELSGLGEGDMVFSAFKNGLAPDSLSTYVSGGSTRLEFVLSEGATVEGVVTLQGEPVNSAQIYGTIMQGEDRDRTYFDVQGRTGKDGRYRVSGLPEGSGSINVSVTDGSERRSKSVQVEVATGLVTEANFEFVEATSTVEGYVFISETETGAGHVNLNVVDTDGGQERRWKETGADGYYKFERLPAGKVSLYDRETRRNTRATGTVGANETLRLDLNLFGGGDVAVNVSGAPGGHQVFAAVVSQDMPIPDAVTEQFFQELQPFMVSQTQVVNGSETMVGVEAGQYNVIAVHYGIQDGVGVD